MAVVTWPLSSGEARGRVGGLIYNTWRGRSYVKQHIHKQSGLSDAQKVIQAYARTATLTWHQAEPPERASWQQFALTHYDPSWTGSPKRLSGYNWFLRTGVLAQLLGYGINLMPPTDLPQYIMRGFHISDIGSDYIEISWTPKSPPPVPAFSIDMWLEGPHNPGIQPSIHRAKRTDFTDEHSGTGGIATPGPGRYTIHFRPIRNDGFPLPFSYLTGLCA